VTQELLCDRKPSSKLLTKVARIWF